MVNECPTILISILQAYVNNKTSKNLEAATLSELLFIIHCSWLPLDLHSLNTALT